jgi:magnesium chelatase subunit D
MMIREIPFEPTTHPGWADVALAFELLAVAPWSLGGVVVRSSPTPQRDQVEAWLPELVPSGGAIQRLPAHVTDDRLLGGLSLADTLRAGKVVTERGLLARADGGLLIVPMAERLDGGVASHLASALDRGEVLVEREGVGDRRPSRFGLVALDEGVADDEQVAPSLEDRLAFSVDLRALGSRSWPFELPDGDEASRARGLFPRVRIDEAAVHALCQAAAALGVDSVRAPILAATAARAHAALAGRALVADEDVAVAARLVLGPRATRVPVGEPEPGSNAPEDASPETTPPPEEGGPPPEPPTPPPEAQADDAEAAADEGDAPEDPPPGDDSDNEAGGPPRPLEDLVLEAAQSGMPAGLLETLSLGQSPRGGGGGPRRGGRAGASQATTAGGRPAGTVVAAPRRGERLNVVETLRAAAPWQRLRRGAAAGDGTTTSPGSSSPRRVQVRQEDFRVTRFRRPTETSVIFSVDASGSAALQRLAEAKGAVEQVLADCYVRRDQVALIGFRGDEATLVLPPTRSLARARRCLAGLAGGGTTPLAAGIDAARELALAARKQGRTPLVVLMTDGRGNVTRDGRRVATDATADALDSAQALRAAGIPTLFLDTSPRPRPRARALAEAMAARYVPLPYVDAAGVSRQVQALSADRASP